MNFGEKLGRLRKQRKMTQKALADSVGVSLRTITNYETGGRYPKQREIYRRIAEVLGVDVNYLLTENESFFIYHEPDNTPVNEQIQRVVAEVQGLFAGGEMDENDKDEMMRAIQDAYWIAKEQEGGDFLDEDFFKQGNYDLNFEKEE